MPEPHATLDEQLPPTAIACTWAQVRPASLVSSAGGMTTAVLTAAGLDLTGSPAQVHLCIPADGARQVAASLLGVADLLDPPTPPAAEVAP